jgi:hypothetical protein
MISQQLKKIAQWSLSSQLFVALISGLIISLPLTAAILPEDRADALYHRYEGGGVTIDGPSILARKQLGQHLSISGNYYIDFVSSASIDVETYASAYTEERTEYRLGADYLHDNTTINLGYTSSEESDYSAGTYSFNISHNAFGDLTTVSLGYSRGSDEVRQNRYEGSGDSKRLAESIFKGNVDRSSYRLGLSQILTKNFIMSFAYETITDEGFLNNPYRNAYAYDPPETVELGVPPKPFPEKYPKTRISNAFGVKAKYFLPWRAALSGEFRTYSDTWDIQGQMFDIGFTQPIKKQWVLDFHYRNYSQTSASFYANAFVGEQLYMARDKELSTFTSTTMGGTLSYEFLHKGWWKIDKGSLNLSYDRIQFDYQDFYDVRQKGGGVDFENAMPYSFSANVYRFYLSIWY